MTSLCIPVVFFLDLVMLRIIIIFVGDIIYVGGVRHITEDDLALYIFIPLAGLFMGLLQYVLLHRYLPRMGWWVIATTGSWLTGILLILMPSWIAANVVGWGLIGLITPNGTLGQFGLFIVGFLSACATATILALLMNKIPQPN